MTDDNTRIYIEYALIPALESAKARGEHIYYLDLMEIPAVLNEVIEALLERNYHLDAHKGQMIITWYTERKHK